VLLYKADESAMQIRLFHCIVWLMSSSGRVFVTGTGRKIWLQPYRRDASGVALIGETTLPVTTFKAGDANIASLHNAWLFFLFLLKQRPGVENYFYRINFAA
jgi:hypothetical protein